MLTISNSFVLHFFQADYRHYVDLLHGMLRLDPGRRLTPARALRLPFFAAATWAEATKTAEETRAKQQQGAQQEAQQENRQHQQQATEDDASAAGAAPVEAAK